MDKLTSYKEYKSNGIKEQYFSNNTIISKSSNNHINKLSNRESRVIDNNDYLEPFQVYVRIKPLLKEIKPQYHHLNLNPNISSTIKFNKDKNLITVTNPSLQVQESRKEKEFIINNIFNENSSNKDLSEAIVTKINTNVLEGFNSTVLAYGVTGSGKTHTLFGDLFSFYNETGLCMYSISNLLISLKNKFDNLNRISQKRINVKDEESNYYKVKVSYLELYNENVIDLLKEYNDTENLKVKVVNNFSNNLNTVVNSNSSLIKETETNVNYNNNIDFPFVFNQDNLMIVEDPNKGIIVPGLSEYEISNINQIKEIILHGNQKRVMASTNKNLFSSRSHAILQISLDQFLNKSDSKNETNRFKYSNAEYSPNTISEFPNNSLYHINNNRENYNVISSKLLFVDLAGSEKGGIEKKKRAQEGVNINKSLLSLSTCINLLSDKTKKGRFIPYRNSKLTRLLKESLGGNIKTIMIACVSQSPYNWEETNNTLQYAITAMNIENKVSKQMRQMSVIKSYVNNVSDSTNLKKKASLDLNTNGNLRNHKGISSSLSKIKNTFNYNNNSNYDNISKNIRSVRSSTKNSRFLDSNMVNYNEDKENIEIISALKNEIDNLKEIILNQKIESELNNNKNQSLFDNLKSGIKSSNNNLKTVSNDLNYMTPDLSYCRLILNDNNSKQIYNERDLELNSYHHNNTETINLNTPPYKDFLDFAGKILQDKTNIEGILNQIISNKQQLSSNSSNSQILKDYKLITQALDHLIHRINDNVVFLIEDKMNLKFNLKEILSLNSHNQKTLVKLYNKEKELQEALFNYYTERDYLSNNNDNNKDSANEEISLVKKEILDIQESIDLNNIEKEKINKEYKEKSILKKQLKESLMTLVKSKNVYIDIEKINFGNNNTENIENAKEKELLISKNKEYQHYLTTIMQDNKEKQEKLMIAESQLSLLRKKLQEAQDQRKIDQTKKMNKYSNNFSGTKHNPSSNNMMNLPINSSNSISISISNNNFNDLTNNKNMKSSASPIQTKNSITKLNNNACNFESLNIRSKSSINNREKRLLVSNSNTLNSINNATESENQNYNFLNHKTINTTNRVRSVSTLRNKDNSNHTNKVKEALEKYESYNNNNNTTVTNSNKKINSKADKSSNNRITTYSDTNNKFKISNSTQQSRALLLQNKHNILNKVKQMTNNNEVNKEIIRTNNNDKMESEAKILTIQSTNLNSNTNNKNLRKNQLQYSKNSYTTITNTNNSSNQNNNANVVYKNTNIYKAEVNKKLQDDISELKKKYLNKFKKGNNNQVIVYEQSEQEINSNIKKNFTSNLDYINNLNLKRDYSCNRVSNNITTSNSKTKISKDEGKQSYTRNISRSQRGEEIINKNSFNTAERTLSLNTKYNLNAKTGKIPSFLEKNNNDTNGMEKFLGFERNKQEKLFQNYLKEKKKSINSNVNHIKNNTNKELNKLFISSPLTNDFNINKIKTIMLTMGNSKMIKEEKGQLITNKHNNNSNKKEVNSVINESKSNSNLLNCNLSVIDLNTISNIKSTNNLTSTSRRASNKSPNKYYNINKHDNNNKKIPNYHYTQYDSNIKAQSPKSTIVNESINETKNLIDCLTPNISNTKTITNINNSDNKNSTILNNKNKNLNNVNHKAYSSNISKKQSMEKIDNFISQTNSIFNNINNKKDKNDFYFGYENALNNNKTNKHIHNNNNKFVSKFINSKSNDVVDINNKITSNISNDVNVNLIIRDTSNNKKKISNYKNSYNKKKTSSEDINKFSKYSSTREKSKSTSNNKNNDINYNQNKYSKSKSDLSDKKVNVVNKSKKNSNNQVTIQPTNNNFNIHSNSKSARVQSLKEARYQRKLSQIKDNNDKYKESSQIFSSLKTHLIEHK